MQRALVITVKQLFVLLLATAALTPMRASAEMYFYESSWQSTTHERRAAYFDTREEAHDWCNLQVSLLGFAGNCSLWADPHGLAGYQAGWLC